MKTLLFNLIASSELFGIEFIDIEDFTELIVRFIFNILIVLFIVRYLYYVNAKSKDYFFSYVIISTIVFFLCFLLENVKLQLGFALGLFAIFGILRYRTSTIPIKEMTYLFLVIGISVINALANKKVSYAELLITNCAILTLTWAGEKFWKYKSESLKTITFEKPELIQPGKREELLKELNKRTGIKINRIRIGNIDYLRDSVNITIYYYDRDNPDNYSGKV